MKVKKILTFGMAAAMCAGLMTGCGDSDTSQFKTYSKCATIDKSLYSAVEYVPESREVTDDEVESEISSFCSDNSETTQDTTSEVKDGDSINIDYVETISGTAKDDATDFTMTIGNDTLGDGSDDQIIGMKPGETKSITASYPDDYSDTTVAGLTVDYEITLNYISVTTTPEYTDELVKTATDGEYTTTDDYTEYLRSNLQDEKNDSADQTDRAAVLKAVRDKVTFDKYPEEEVASYIQSLMTSAQSAADNYGIDFSVYMSYFYGYSDEASFLEYLRTTVESVMQEKIVVSCIALDNDLVADDDDIAAYRAKLVEDNGYESDSDVDTYYTSEDLMFYATEENVLDFLMDTAVQVDSTEESTEDSSESETENSEETTADSEADTSSDSDTGTSEADEE